MNFDTCPACNGEWIYGTIKNSPGIGDCSNACGMRHYLLTSGVSMRCFKFCSKDETLVVLWEADKDETNIVFLNNGLPKWNKWEVLYKINSYLPFDIDTKMIAMRAEKLLLLI